MLMIEEYAFAFAHRLLTFPEGHKCREIHGHTATVTIHVAVNDGPGYAFDHAALDDIAKVVLTPLDHHMINEVPGLEDGLAESMLAWLVREFAPLLTLIGGRLVRLDLVELSSGRNFRLTKHQKTWTAE